MKCPATDMTLSGYDFLNLDQVCIEILALSEELGKVVVYLAVVSVYPFSSSTFLSSPFPSILVISIW